MNRLKRLLETPYASGFCHGWAIACVLNAFGHWWIMRVKNETFEVMLDTNNRLYETNEAILREKRDHHNRVPLLPE